MVQRIPKITTATSEKEVLEIRIRFQIRISNPHTLSDFPVFESQPINSLALLV